MTTTTVDQLEITDEQAAAKNLLKLTDLQGIDIFVSRDSGKFLAKFSQGAGAKWFERDGLGALRALITQAVFPFSGHVPAATRPVNLIGQRALDQLREALDQDKKGYSYGKVYKERPVTTFTGVQRVSRNGRGDQAFYLRTDDGKTESVENGQYVQPRAILDLAYYQLAVEYLANQEEWNAKFQAIIDEYKPFTIGQIIDMLREQGARTGRA